MLVRKVTALSASEIAPACLVGSRSQRFSITIAAATKAAAGRSRFALRAMKFVMEKDLSWIISWRIASVIKKPEMTKNKSTPRKPDGSMEESR